MKATERFRARLHQVTQQWLRDLVAEVVAAHTPPATRVSPRKTKRRRPKQAPQRDPRVSVPAPSVDRAKPEPAAPLLPLSTHRASVEKAEVTVSSPAKRWDLPCASATPQPKPAGAPALMGAPRAPLVAAGRGRTAPELSAVGRRGAEAAKASRATERALGPTAKTSMSDDELEAWAVERLAAGDLPPVMTLKEEDDA